MCIMNNRDRSHAGYP